MDRTAYTRALRAAAQVSFVALAGCAAATESVEGTDDTTPASAEGAARAKKPTASARARAEAKAATTRPSGCDAGTDAPQLTCAERLKAAFPNGDEQNWFDAPHVDDAALAACCNAAGAALDPNGNDWKSLEEFRNSGCCSVKDVTTVSSACTPWGPPVPPSVASWLRSLESAGVRLA